MNAMEALHHAHKLFPEMPRPNVNYANVAVELCTGHLDVYARYGTISLPALNDLPGLTYLYFLAAQHGGQLGTIDLSSTRIESLYITVHNYGDVIVPRLPTTLKELRVVGSGRVEFAGTFPAGLNCLKLADIKGDIVCLPALPAGLKTLIAPVHLIENLPDIPPGCSRRRWRSINCPARQGYPYDIDE